MKILPKVGNFYHFWDDGKLSTSRHYIAKCEELIKLKDCEYIKIGRKSLRDIWVKEKIHKNWIFAQSTDYIVKCSIPNYDDDPIYFARTTDGGWFSMNTTGWWQGGRLDIDNSTYEEMLEYWKDDEEILEMYKSATYEKILDNE